MRFFCTYRQVFPGFRPISGGMYTEYALEGSLAVHTGYVLHSTKQRRICFSLK